MANYGRTRAGTAKALINRAAFVKGYQEAHRGLPLDPDWGKNTNEQWYYERGRLFASVFDGKLKNGRRVTYESQRQLSNAINQGSII